MKMSGRTRRTSARASGVRRGKSCCGPGRRSSGSRQGSSSRSLGTSMSAVRADAADRAQVNIHQRGARLTLAARLPRPGRRPTRRRAAGHSERLSAIGEKPSCAAIASTVALSRPPRQEHNRGSQHCSGIEPTSRSSGPPVVRPANRPMICTRSIDVARPVIASHSTIAAIQPTSHPPPTTYGCGMAVVSDRMTANLSRPSTESCGPVMPTIRDVRRPLGQHTFVGGLHVRMMCPKTAVTRPSRCHPDRDFLARRLGRERR